MNEISRYGMLRLGDNLNARVMRHLKLYAPE